MSSLLLQTKVARLPLAVRPSQPESVTTHSASLFLNYRWRPPSATNTGTGALFWEDPPPSPQPTWLLRHLRYWLACPCLKGTLQDALLYPALTSPLLFTSSPGTSVTSTLLNLCKWISSDPRGSCSIPTKITTKAVFATLREAAT